MRDLSALLDQLEQADGPPDPVPSADGWELVLAENVAYLVDDQRRWRALAELRTTVGLAPEQIVAATEQVLRGIVTGPGDRVQRLRRCAELAIAGAPWRAYPGIGQPGQDRIDLFTGSRPVFALDANALRVLTRLGYATPARSYSASYRQAQARGQRAAARHRPGAPARSPAAPPSRPAHLPAQGPGLRRLLRGRRLPERRPPAAAVLGELPADRPA